jgi:hypothetical protein
MARLKTFCPCCNESEQTNARLSFVVTSTKQISFLKKTQDLSKIQNPLFAFEYVCTWVNGKQKAHTPTLKYFIVTFFDSRRGVFFKYSARNSASFFVYKSTVECS